MGNTLICAPNYAFSTINPINVSNGDWENADYLTNLNNEFFVNKSISIDATEAATIFDIHFPVPRDIKLVAIPNSNVSRTGKIIVEGSNFSAWEGVTITGIEGIAETTINVTATGQAYIIAGQGLTITGDTEVYQVVTGVTLGQNDLIRSEEFDNAAWTKTNVTVTANNDDSPDNTKTMDRLVETAVNDVHEVEQDSPSVTLGTQHTYSIFVKAGERDQVRLILDGAAFAGESADFNLTTGVGINGATAPDSFEIEQVATLGIFRISITATATATGTGTCKAGILDSGGSSSYLGDILKGLSVWGAQFVAGTIDLRYVQSLATVISATAGDIVIKRANNNPTTGLVVATTGGETITAESGDYISHKIFSSGLIDYQPIVYGPGDRVWGSAGVWDGKEDPEITAATQLPNQFIHLNANIKVVDFIRTIIRDSSNADGFISVDAEYTTSAYRPTCNMDYGASNGTISNTAFEESAGGVIAFDKEAAGRLTSFTLNNIPLDEALVNSFDLNRRLDISESFYYIYDEDDTKHLTRRSFPALLKQLFPNIATRFNINSVKYQVKEKLG